ncbi:MAG TPA: CvpA family protein [Stellaceae bacterium]|nr:CvpA family protein [Stellaceae bacterium]
MNPLDLGVIAFIALSALFAFARGLVREALSIVAWVGAALATLYGYPYVYAFFDPLVHNSLLTQVIAIGGTFIGSLIVLTMLTGLVARMVRIGPLAPIDRTLGFIFGLVRGAALVSLAYLLLDTFVQQDQRPAWLRDAKSGPYLAQGADMLRAFLPETMKVKNPNGAEETAPRPDPATEARRAMQAPAKAAGPPTATPPAAPTYRPNERREMNRLINNQ